MNRGSHGMMARLRWALSPDRCALLAVEDPVAVEADPVPNGFVLASERHGVLQRDSVWDVAPSPDWTRVAYGRAYTHSAGGRESVAAAEWETLARRVGLPVDVVRRAAFPSSGMALAYGVSRPVVEDVAAAGRLGAGARPAPLPTTGGWRVAWTRDGSALVLGDAPRTGNDDSAPKQWTVVALRPSAAAPSASASPRPLDTDVERAAVTWTEGPVIELSVPIDTSAAPPPLAVDGGTVESRGGAIQLVTPSGSQRVGRGVALAATRTGRYVAALLPLDDPPAHGPQAAFVVYQLK